MNPDGVNLLSQLRDIHAAPQAAWWPPAPGWWLLALLGLIGLVLLLRHILARWLVRRRRRLLLRQLDELQTGLDAGSRPQEYVAAINRVLKSVAIRAFPGECCERMEGLQWVRFLVQKFGPEAPAGLDALASGPYQPQPEFDSVMLDGLARQWILRYG